MQKVSASTAVPKHKICSISESKKQLSRASAVDMTEFIACSLEDSAAPANQRALWSGGRLSMRMWNRVLPFCPLGASSSWIILKIDTMWRSDGSQNSATSRIAEVKRPSAAS